MICTSAQSQLTKHDINNHDQSQFNKQGFLHSDTFKLPELTTRALEACAVVHILNPKTDVRLSVHERFTAQFIINLSATA